MTKLLLSTRQYLAAEQADGYVSDPSELYDRVELREALVHALARLTPREELVIRLRFGLNDGKEHSRREVAEDFLVCHERIGQMERKALRKLRHPSFGALGLREWHGPEKPRETYKDVTSGWASKPFWAPKPPAPIKKVKAYPTMHCKAPRCRRLVVKGSLKWCLLHMTWACTYCGEGQRMESPTQRPADCSCGRADFVRFGASTKAERQRWSVRKARGVTAPKKITLEDVSMGMSVEELEIMRDYLVEQRTEPVSAILQLVRRATKLSKRFDGQHRRETFMKLSHGIARTIVHYHHKGAQS